MKTTLKLAKDQVSVPEIVPSLLAADFSDLRGEISKVEKAGCLSLHFDVMDGHFVPNLSFGPALLAKVRRLTGLRLVAHLMVTNPHLFLKPFKDAGADEIIIHPEIGPRYLKTFREIKRLGLKAGLALKPKTPLKAVGRLFPELDFLLIMSVEPGFGGQDYIEGSEKKIKEAAERARRRRRPLCIGVDGGINFSNAALVAEAGATHLIAGSAVFQGNVASNVRWLRRRAEEGMRRSREK